MMDMSPLNLLRGGEVKEHTKPPASDRREGEGEAKPVFTIDESLFNPAAAVTQPLPSEITGRNIEGDAQPSTPLDFSGSGEEEPSSALTASTAVPVESGDVEMVGESEGESNARIDVSDRFQSPQPDGEMAEGDDLLNEKGLDGVSEEALNEPTQDGDGESLLFKELGTSEGGDQRLSTVVSQISSHSIRDRKEDEKGEVDEEQSGDEAIDDGGGEGGGGERSAPLSSTSQHGAAGDGGEQGRFSGPLETTPDVEPLLQGNDFEVTSGEERGEAKEASTATRSGGAPSTSNTLGRMVVEQVGSKIGLFFRDGIGKASIRLDPPSLGRLQIEIVMKERMARAHIVAEHESVKELIEQNLSTLKDALAKQGISVEDVTVSLDSKGSESSDGMGWGEEGEMEGWGGTNLNHRAGVRSPASPVLSNSKPTSGVDIYV